jgi:CheY-like chemotaxis protein
MSKENPDCVILAAEDSAADVTLVREALKEHHVDCTLHMTRDGAQTISFLNGLDIDPKEPRLELILFDMHLPHRDGADILKKLQSLEHYGQTPVIVMTASDAPDELVDAERNAALHYFRKPTTLAEFMRLGAIVKSVLGSRKESLLDVKSTTQKTRGTA